MDVVDESLDESLDECVEEYQHFLLRLEEEFPHWTRHPASTRFKQLEQLKTKANEVVRDIEQTINKPMEEEEELKNFPNSDSSLLHLKAILINFQQLIQIIQQVRTDRLIINYPSFNSFPPQCDTVDGK